MRGRSHVAWEKNQPAAQIEEFKQFYLDPTIPNADIAAEFGMNATSVSNIASRLGLPARRLRGPNKPSAVTLEALETEEQELTRRLQELKQQKLAMTVRVVKNGSANTFMVHGLTPEPFTTTGEFIMNFLDGQGAGKMRDAVGRKP